MSWQNKGRKMSLGKFCKPKPERSVLIQFIGEPLETQGKNFKQETVDELQFPVLFWDERAASQRYEPGEAARIIQSNPGENKVLPVQGGPLMRELLEEDEQEPILGRYFVLSHTGQAKDTVYKLREIKVSKQAVVVKQEDSEQNNIEVTETQGVPAEEVKKQNDDAREKFKKDVEKYRQHAEEQAAKEKPKRQRKKPVESGSSAEENATSTTV